MTATAFIVEEFVSVSKNTLVAFARVRTPRGIIFHDVSVHKKGDSAWASPASKAMVGRDGAQIKDANGKPRYTPVVSFDSRETRERWSERVVEALLSTRPEVFG